MVRKESVASTGISIFTPSGASWDLINRLDRAVGELNRRTCRQPNLCEKIDREILIESMLALSPGAQNRFSKREISAVLSAPSAQAPSGPDAGEIRSFASALLSIRPAPQANKSLDPDALKSMHKIVMTGTGGSFREEEQAESAGPRVPSPEKIEGLVDSVLRDPALENDALHPIQKAAWLHWSIARIRPFPDGNGRVARLAQDHLLQKYGYIPAPLRPEDRETVYREALEAADGGNGRPLVELIARNCLWMADRCASLLEDSEERESWVARISRAVSSRAEEADLRRFLSAQRGFAVIRNEFLNLTKELNPRLKDLSIGFRDYGSLDFTRFKEIAAGGEPADSWSFGLQFDIFDTTLRYVFQYGRHRAGSWDSTERFPSEAVLLVSVEEQGYFRLLEEFPGDAVTLREVVPDDKLFWRRRFDRERQVDLWERGITGGQAARDFLEEALVKLGLL